MNNEEKLKRQADLTEAFVKIVDKLKIDDEDVPKTEKGLNTKAKELLKRVEKKLKKLESEEDSGEDE